MMVHFLLYIYRVMCDHEYYFNIHYMSYLHVTQLRKLILETTIIKIAFSQLLCSSQSRRLASAKHAVVRAEGAGAL
jgi:hypothetical protein